MITQLIVAFSQNVTITSPIAAAFQLHRDSSPTGGNEQPGVTGLVNLTAVQMGNVVVLTFNSTGSNPINGVGGAGNLSLPDGRYTLTVVGSAVMNPGATMAGDFVLASAPAPAGPTNIFRLFGDINGDGAVSAFDFVVFRQSFNAMNFALDYNGDGGIGANDFMEFRSRFNSIVP